MAEIIFNKDFPEIAHSKVEAILNEFDWLLPTWLQRLYVGYVGDEKDSSAYIAIEKDYRFANLRICGHWIGEAGDVQREGVIHELIHLHFSPLKNYAAETIETLCDGNKTMFEVIRPELVSKNEMATQDLAFAIANKFKDA